MVRAKQATSRSGKGVMAAVRGVKSPRLTTTLGVKKPKRFRPGTVALREIRRYQKSKG